MTCHIMLYWLIVITNVMFVTTLPVSHEPGPGPSSDMTTVNSVINLISKGFHCSIAPINLEEADQDGVKVFCDTARYTCYECVKNIQNVGEFETKSDTGDEVMNKDKIEIFSAAAISVSMMTVLSELVYSGHKCGVTTIQVTFYQKYYEYL